jgi:hypothetical protein
MTFLQFSTSIATSLPQAKRSFQSAGERTLFRSNAVQNFKSKGIRSLKTIPEQDFAHD